MFDNLKSEDIEALDRVLRSTTVSNTSGTTQRESLSDLLTQISPTDTPLLMRVSKGRVYAPTHFWVEQTFTTGYTGLKYSESGTPTDTTPTTTRKSNAVMTLGTFARASNLVRKYTQVGGDALARELTANLSKLNLGIEYYLWNGASGATGGIEFSGVLEWLAGANTTGASSTGALPEKDLKNAITRIFNNTGAKPTHIFCNPEVAYRIASFNQTNIRVPAGSAPGGVTSESLGYYSPMGNMMEVVPVRPDLLASGNVVILTAPFLQVLHATDNLIDIEEIPANEADVLSIRMKSYLTLEMRNLQAHSRITGCSSVVE